MDRRTVLKGGLVFAATSHAAVLAPEMAKAPSVDEFLKVALPSEIIRYHTNALMEAMAAAHPEKAWASFTELDLSQVLIVGRDRA